MATARYIDIHLLHTVPYANLNRDDLGSPKTVRFGGVERTRVSSQCWKRAVRLALEESSGDAAKRTRRVPLEVADRLRARGWADELATFAGQQIAASITSKGLGLEKNGGTSVLLYLPARAFDELTTLCVDHQEALAAAHASGGKKKAEKTETLPRDRVAEIIAGRNSVINLFGRMLADVPTSHVDGAVQVAHAFTVHGTSPEVDFFTAVDDLNKEAEETGSGHMNSGEFSAGTFYRYASINLADLAKNLDGDADLAAQLAADFISAFITTMPEAKKNSTAPFTVPDLAYVAARADRPVSLASAFEAPVNAYMEGGYGSRAQQTLNDYVGRIHKLLGTDGLIRHAHATTGDKLDGLGEQVESFPQLVRLAIGQAEPQ
ncbi:type I-E CRISPR-associated protein Cas7/Cse4/CasC [Micromonospora sonneratiae]|uniref:Type I-E CRISPR-associated protein Cas7/Cse4/CasC n=1 Tax=Micromonospora sonneratiae TaxID=1184706 RepID=A0ABW3YPW6_9ACTN